MNLGLDPSERALTSYGNTSAAMGKSLNDLVEAVADATVGEFERLKEFGIKASSEGDRVAFTFRGVRTEIGKNAGEIEEFLIKLGETEFAGGMQARMETVGGQITNLGDLWDKLFRTISELGVGSLIGATVQVGIDILTKLIALLESGRVEAAIDSWNNAFVSWANDFEQTTNFITDFFGAASSELEQTGTEPWDEIAFKIKSIPDVLRIMIQRMVIEFTNLVLIIKEVGKLIIETFKTAFNAVVDLAAETGTAIGESLKAAVTLSDPTEPLRDALLNIQSIGRQVAVNVAGDFRNTLTGISASLDARREQINKAEQELLNSLDNRANAEPFVGPPAPGLDTSGGLGQFRVGAVGSGAASSGASRGGRKSRGPATVKPKLTEFQKLKDELLKEELAIEESLIKRLDLIRKNTEDGSELRATLTDKVKEQFLEESEALRQKTFNDLDIQEEGYQSAIDALNQFYAERRETILNNETLTEQEKTEIVTKFAQERAELVAKIEAQQQAERLQVTSDFFGALSQISAFENKKAAKIAKGAAIAQATIDTYASANAAFNSLAGVPVVGFNLATAAAAAAIVAGLSNVASIAATNVGGFQGGGVIPGNSFSGDRLTANVNSGEMVLNASQQSRLFELANGRGGSGKVTIINQTGQQIETASQTTQADGTTEIVLRAARMGADMAKSEIAAESRTGEGNVVKSLQRSFGLTRKGS